MIKYYFFILLFLSFSMLSAQEKLTKEERTRREKNIKAGNPFLKYGCKAPVATLSKGKYLEVHDLDSIVIIGTTRWHVYKKIILGDIKKESLNLDAQPTGDVPGMWMSPDPLSEEYPSWNPYNYCKQNPLNLIDPDGLAPQDIIIIIGKHELKYENGNLYNKDGSSYTGKLDKFTQKTVDALGQIAKGSEGASMISELQSSNNIYTIENGESQFNNSNKYKAYANQFATDPTQAGTLDLLTQSGIDISGGSGGAVQWNPSGGLLSTVNGMQTNAITDLAHEMFHALDSNRGLLDDRLENDVKRDEWQAVYRENILRSQLGNPLRNFYQHEIDEDGVKSGIGPSMLSPSNTNDKPSWYKLN